MVVTCSGAAKSDEEAERVCEALKNAGIVLRVGDTVYLKPEEVVEIILRVSSPLFFHILRSSWTQLLDVALHIMNRQDSAHTP